MARHGLYIHSVSPAVNSESFSNRIFWLCLLSLNTFKVWKLQTILTNTISLVIDIPICFFPFCVQPRAYNQALLIKLIVFAFVKLFPTFLIICVAPLVYPLTVFLWM